ncbi:hypothetical protein D3C71_1777860 [compost metagenome]
MAQLQPFERIGYVEQRRRGSVAGLLGSAEGVELPLQALQARIVGGTAEIITEQRFQCSPLLCQCPVTNAQRDIGA